MKKFTINNTLYKPLATTKFKLDVLKLNHLQLILNHSYNVEAWVDEWCCNYLNDYFLKQCKDNDITYLDIAKKINSSNELCDFMYSTYVDITLYEIENFDDDEITYNLVISQDEE